MPLGNLEVVRIVGWCHFHSAGAELRIHRLGGNNGNRSLDEGQQHKAPDDVPVSLVVRVDGNRGVSEHGLGPGGRHRDSPGTVNERVRYVYQLANVVLVFDLDLGNGGPAARTPVDDAVASIDQPLFVETDEHLPDGFAEPFVEPEALASPIYRSPQPPPLQTDPA